jgi:tetratricopeptide (TPR) repeat protein
MAWSIGFYGLAFFFNYPHYMATLYRAYHRPDDFNRYRIFTVHITGLVLLTLLLSHFYVSALPWIFTLYLTLSPWHYSGQNYGIFMMFARRAGAAPTEKQRQSLYLAFLFSYLILFLSFHGAPSHDPLFISIGIPSRVAAILVAPLTLGFIAFSVYGLSGVAEQVGWKALIPSLTLFSTQFVWFLLPTALSFGERLQIPQSRYSTGVLAVMHSAQYLWITSYYAKREASTEGNTNWKPIAYFAFLILGGIALFVPGPWLASRIFHHDFTTSFLIFTALVNLHHFILDGAIWKLREGRIAAVLLNSRESVSRTSEAAGNQVAAGWKWMTGNSAAARTLRVGSALALLTLGTVDQIRYYYALHRDTLTDLQRAAALNSFDSSLETKLGATAFAQGQVNEALAAWKQALRANPSDAAPRNAILQTLVSQKQFEEAYSVSKEALRFAPQDADLMLNHGILASNLGHEQEAVQAWEKALEINPSHARAHLYLARALDASGKAEQAIPHYVAYLDNIEQLAPRPPAQETIAIVLRLAECQGQSKRPEQAALSYGLAQKIAAQTKQVKLESFAAVKEAELRAAEKRTAQALQLYQRALRLDASTDDRTSEGADWYNLALFLRDQGFETQLVYASLLEAESLLKSSPGENLKLVTGERMRTESILGRRAAQVRKDLSTQLATALNLSL